MKETQEQGFGERDQYVSESKSSYQYKTFIIFSK